MFKDFKLFTVHVNSAHLNNFGLGFDYYHIYDYKLNTHDATILLLNLLFFNITFTRWH